MTKIHIALKGTEGYLGNPEDLRQRTIKEWAVLAPKVMAIPGVKLVKLNTFAITLEVETFMARIKLKLALPRDWVTDSRWPPAPPLRLSDMLGSERAALDQNDRDEDKTVVPPQEPPKP